MDTDWNEHIETVKDWLAEYDCFVEETTDEEDRFEPESNMIYLNSRQWAETRFYTLLHEVGHFLISQDWSTLFDTNTSMYANCHYDGRSERRRDFKVNRIIEEGAAWKFGLQLAERLEIEIDIERYNKFMSKYMMSYIQWAVE